MKTMATWKREDILTDTATQIRHSLYVARQILAIENQQYTTARCR